MSSRGATMLWAKWGLRLPESQAELVLSTNLEYAVN